MNAPFIEAIPGFEEGKESVVNAFLPQMVPMANADEGETAWQTMRQLMPVVNDVNTLISMAVEQGRVIGSENHMTSRAEQRHAWDEWRTFQEQVKGMLEEAGLSWNQAVRNPELNFLIQSEKTRISNQYPSWKQGLGDGIAHSQAVEMELRERVQYPEEPADLLLAEYKVMMDQWEDAVGMTFSGSPENMSPESFELFRRIAEQFAKEDPRFLVLYNRFYRRTLGDIVENIA